MSEWTSAQIVKLLRERYKSPENGFNKAVVLEEVANGTGSYQHRWIDAAVFEMWPSKGLSRSAFEVKVSRADFINELRQPEKQDDWRRIFPWFEGPYGFVLANAVMYNKPIPYKGRLGFFDVPDEIVRPAQTSSDYSR